MSRFLTPMLRAAAAKGGGNRGVCERPPTGHTTIQTAAFRRHSAGPGPWAHMGCSNVCTDCAHPTALGLTAAAGEAGDPREPGKWGMEQTPPPTHLLPQAGWTRGCTRKGHAGMGLCWATSPLLYVPGGWLDGVASPKSRASSRSLAPSMLDCLGQGLAGCAGLAAEAPVQQHPGWAGGQAALSLVGWPLGEAGSGGGGLTGRHQSWCPRPARD